MNFLVAYWFVILSSGFQDYLWDCQQWPKAREQLRQAAHDACSSLESQLRPWLKRACRAFLLCQQCAVHGEQFIMFSNSQKNMLCVNCFRDTPQEARLHCVDIDSAYTQGCKKLDRAVLVSTLFWQIIIFYLLLRNKIFIINWHNNLYIQLQNFLMIW